MPNGPSCEVWRPAIHLNLNVLLFQGLMNVDYEAEVEDEMLSIFRKGEVGHNFCYWNVNSYAKFLCPYILKLWWFKWMLCVGVQLWSRICDSDFISWWSICWKSGRCVSFPGFVDIWISFLDSPINSRYMYFWPSCQNCFFVIWLKCALGLSLSKSPISVKKCWVKEIYSHEWTLVVTFLGSNFTPSSKDYTHGAVLRFRSGEPLFMISIILYSLSHWSGWVLHGGLFCSWGFRDFYEQQRVQRCKNSSKMHSKSVLTIHELLECA